MSTKFYIKDEKGIYLSTDGKVRYTLLEGSQTRGCMESRDMSRAARRKNAKGKLKLRTPSAMLRGNEFEALHGDPDFEKLCERVKALIVTKPPQSEE